MSEPSRAWRAVAAMFALNGALVGIWASRIPGVAETHALDNGALGLLLLVMAAGAIVSFPIAGRLSDRHGAYRVTWATAMGYAASLVLLALAPSVTTLAAALFVFGATHGAMDVAMNAWAGEVERQAGRPQMSSFHAMWSLGAGLGALTGVAAVQLGLAIPVHFLVAGAAVVAGSFALARIGWRSERHETRTGPGFVLPRGALLLAGVAAMCASIGEGGIADWSGLFLIRETGVSEALAPVGYATFSAVMVAMRLAGDRVIAQLGPVRAGRLAGLSAALGATIVVSFATFWTALFGFCLMALGYALVVPLAFSRAASDPELSPGTAIAAVSILGYGGILIGPPLLGFVGELTSVRFAFAVLAVLALVVTAAAGAFRKAPR